MKRKWIIFSLILVVAGGGIFLRFKQKAAEKSNAPLIEKARIERGSLRLTVNSTGRVISNLDVDIKCKASGEVVKLPYEVSDSVRKGDLLVELDPVDEFRGLKKAETNLSASQGKLAIAHQNLEIAQQNLATEIKRAQAGLQSAEAQAKDSRVKADRMKQLLEKELGSQEEYDSAETNAIQAAAELKRAQIKIEELKTQEAALELKRLEVKLAEAQVESDTIALSEAEDRLKDTKVVAPMNGVVTVRNVQVGQIISSGISNVGGGTTVLTLSDLAHIFVLAAVDESDIGQVQLGQTVIITADAFPGKTFQGQVVQINTRGTNISNVVTFEVKIEVNDEKKVLLKPEMTANVEILAAEKQGVLVAPVEAVTRKGGKFLAKIVKTDGTTEEREVVTGISDSVKTEIVSGLSEGEEAVLQQGAAESRWNADERRKNDRSRRSAMLPRF